MRRRRRKRRGKLIPSLLLIFVFVIGLIALMETQFGPVIVSLAKQKAHAYAVNNLQSAVQEQMLSHQEDFAYQNIMHIEKDSDGRIILMSPDALQINLLVSRIVLEAEHAFDNMQADDLSIPLGVATGSKLFASIGPNINIRVTPVGKVNINIRDDFDDAGINQTRHRIWLDIESDMQLAVPFNKDHFSVSTSVLLAESIIVGPIPQTYVNIGDGLFGGLGN